MKVIKFEQQQEFFHEKKFSLVEGAGSWYATSLNVRGHEKVPDGDHFFNNLSCPIPESIELLLNISPTVDYIKGYQIRNFNKILLKIERDERECLEDFMHFLKNQLSNQENHRKKLKDFPKNELVNHQK